MSADPHIDAAEAAALFRYKLIAAAANPRLGPLGLESGSTQATGLGLLPIETELESVKRLARTAGMGAR